MDNIRWNAVFKWRADDGLASVYPKWCPGILSRVKLLHFYDSNSYLAKKNIANSAWKN